MMEKKEIKFIRLSNVEYRVFNILKCISHLRPWPIPRNYQIYKIRLLYNQTTNPTIVEATMLGEEFGCCSFRKRAMKILNLLLLQDIFTLLVIQKNQCQWAQKKIMAAFNLFKQEQQRFIVYFTLEHPRQASALNLELKHRKTIISYYLSYLSLEQERGRCPNFLSNMHKM